SGSRSAIRELSHCPGRSGCPRGGRPRSSCAKSGQTPGDPGGGYRGALPVAGGPGRVHRRTRRGHHETRFEVPRWICPRRPRASPGGRGPPSAAEIRFQGAIMSVKIEANGRRSVQVEFEVQGTPEEIWQALATGPGISSWFVPTDIDERDGKPVAVNYHFGPGMEIRSVVTAYDAPRTFAQQGEGMTPGSPPMATEWRIEARAGGICIVRFVHSLFASTDDWDNQLE